MTADLPAADAPEAGPPAAPTPLDERVLSAGVALRFVLLLLLFAAAGAAMLSETVQQITEPAGASSMEMNCWLAAGADPAAPMYADSPLSVKNESEVNACIARYDPNHPWVPVAVVALLVAAAVALYWLLPAWKARRSKMVPLDEWDADGRLKSVIGKLVATAAGLTRPPDFVIDRAAVATADAWVFGRWRHHTICLDAGLAVTAGTDRFRAVVLHELAHVRNKDVSVTYATIALWRVFLVLVLLPQVAILIEDVAANWTPGSWGIEAFYAHDVALVALIVVSVYLTRASILRNREIYADLLAVRWGARRQAWDVRAAPRTAAWPRLLTASAELWSTHPAPTLRRASLTDPKALFALDALTMLLTGLAADILAGQLGLLGANNGDPLARQAQAILVAVLAVGVGGVALWRAVVHAILTGRPTPSGWQVGLCLGTGIAAGELIGTGAAGNSWLPSQPEALLVLVAALVLVMTWTAQNAEWWVRSWPGRSLRPAMLIALAAAALAFACVLYWWYDQGYVLLNGWPYSTAGLLNSYGLPRLTVGHISAVLRIFVVIDVLPGFDATAGSLWWAASLLWLLPLLVLTMRPLTRRPPWLARALPGTDAPLARQLPRLSRVWGTGLAGGLVTCLGLAAAMARMHGSFAADKNLTDAYTMVHLAWPVLVICSVMALTSAVVAAATESAWLLAGLIAAGITAVLGVVTAFLLGSVDGCLGPLATMTTVCRWLPDGSWPVVRAVMPLPLTLGMLAAGLAAFAGRSARLLWLRFRRPRQHAPAHRLPEPSNRGARLAGARVTVAALVAGLATLTVTGTVPSGAPETAAHAQASVPAVNPAGAPSASVTLLQAKAWAALGGVDLLNGFYPAQSAYNSAIAAAADATTEAQFATALRELSASCGRIAQATQQADAYFTMPVPAGEQLWSQMLARYRQWTTACRRLGAHSSIADVKAATTDYQNAVSSRVEMLNWLVRSGAAYLEPK